MFSPMFHHVGRSHAGEAEPYSNAAQTNIVINYHGIPTVLIGEGAFLVYFCQLLPRVSDACPTSARGFSSLKQLFGIT